MQIHAVDTVVFVRDFPDVVDIVMKRRQTEKCVDSLCRLSGLRSKIVIRHNQQAVRTTLNRIAEPQNRSARNLIGLQRVSSPALNRHFLDRRIAIRWPILDPAAAKYRFKRRHDRPHIADQSDYFYGPAKNFFQRFNVVQPAPRFVEDDLSVGAESTLGLTCSSPWL